MSLTLPGIVNAPLKPAHSSNALAPILVTASGIVNVPVKPLQPAKVPSSIIFNEEGRCKLPVKLEHIKNAFCPI